MTSKLAQIGAFFLILGSLPGVAAADATRSSAPILLAATSLTIEDIIRRDEETANRGAIPQKQPPQGKSQSGLLQQAFRAIKASRGGEAIQVWSRMSPGLDRDLVAWRLARIGGKGVPLSVYTDVMKRRGNWPASSSIQKNFEVALSKSGASAQRIVSLLGTSAVTREGNLILARAYQALGDTKRAQDIGRSLWRNYTLTAGSENTVLRLMGNGLRASDHAFRMRKQLHRERARSVERMMRYLSSSDRAIAKAWIAGLRGQSNTKSLFAAVPASARKDPSYLFALAKYNRRRGAYTLAAQALVQAPGDVSNRADPKDWWTDRRVLSRNLIDVGKPRLAYQLVASHKGGSEGNQVQATFHAGWYALRFLNDPRRARGHFEALRKLGTIPTTIARAHYWLGRTNEALGQSAGNHYSVAAQYPWTFYGQLSMAKVGRTKLSNLRRPGVSNSDKAQVHGHPFFAAAKRLADVGFKSQSLPFLNTLGWRVKSAGATAYLSDIARSYGSEKIALRIAKAGLRRGYPVLGLAFPAHPVPKTVRLAPGVDRIMVLAVARQESEFAIDARSSADARGFLQLLPSTAKETARKAGLAYSPKRLSSDAAYNVRLGSFYLSGVLQRFSGSLILGFSGYNAGPGNASKWLKLRGAPGGRSVEHAVDWIERIPFTETRKYVKFLLTNMQVYRVIVDNKPSQITSDLRR